MAGKSDALNLLMVAARYYPYMGGIETHIHEVGPRLARKGINVTLLTTIPPQSDLPEEEMVAGMRVLRIPAWPSRRDYYLAPKMYAIISRGKWDVVHCQGCHTLVPPLAMFAAKEASVPYAVTFHTGGHSSGFRNRIRGVQWRLQRRLLANASKLVGVSHFEANYFRDILRLPAQQFAVIPNGAVLPDLRKRPEERAEQTLIVSVGRLERYKGHQHLITALPKIHEQRPDARLLILGTGPYESALWDIARRSNVVPLVDIRAVPPGDRQAMAEILSGASIVALMSEYEAHPIAVMEALALRCPVIVADNSGMRELAEQGLVRAVPLNSSSETIAEVILQQIDHPVIPSTSVALPTWDDCARQLQSIYVSIARRKSCVF